MSISSFDYAIIGAGAAGLHLALKMSEDRFFDEKTILIIEKEEKTDNDKTWSFWEIGESTWDSISVKSWNQAHFYGNHKHELLELDPYRYKSIRSQDFYAYAKNKIEQKENISWVNEEVIAIEDHEITATNSYQADHIFDSRISNKFHEEKGSHHTLAQHFLGWTIETEEDSFDDTSFTMMDYRLKWKDSTSFMYILPFSKRTALFEYTFFDKEILQTKDYEGMIRKYIAEYTNISKYEIIETEQGVIPMTTFPFHAEHTRTLTKIGTAGGWVRPSSGYSFKNADRYSSMVIQNLKEGNLPSKGIANNRFRFYDKIFLDVLFNHNKLGEEIFTNLYTKSKIQKLFRFLDESSYFVEELGVMTTVNSEKFRSAFFRNL